ncbi:MAG: WecB/TagA/CpsF family glycosyltransferase [Caldilineaceae bacterium]|nr:WecB/TagA/CpsF family glycosyltransferase [Caldilineaceae bacterium]
MAISPIATHTPVTPTVVPAAHTDQFTIPTVSVLGTKLSLCNNQELLAYLTNAIRRRQKATVLSGNIYSFNLAYEQPWLQSFFNHADVVRLDGAGVRLGSLLLGHRTPHRMTWADFAWDVAAHAEEEGHSLFFLGARHGIAQKAAAKLQQRYPSLHIAGTAHGYFEKTANCEESRQVIDTINQAQPDILVIGFGMPVQERWLYHHRDLIDAKVVLTGGAVFDYISGELKRAPTWMTTYGMEWVGRLLIEPKRLWRRYLLGNPLFFWRIAKQMMPRPRYLLGEPR